LRESEAAETGAGNEEPRLKTDAAVGEGVVGKRVKGEDSMGVPVDGGGYADVVALTEIRSIVHRINHEHAGAVRVDGDGIVQIGKGAGNYPVAAPARNLQLMRPGVPDICQDLV